MEEEARRINKNNCCERSYTTIASTCMMSTVNSSFLSRVLSRISFSVVLVLLCHVPLGLAQNSNVIHPKLSGSLDSYSSSGEGNSIRDFQFVEESDLPAADEDIHHHFTHQWAAHIIGGNAEADRIARKHGFVNGGEIFRDYYHFVHRKVAKRSLEAHSEIHGLLTGEPTVRWAEQQRVKRRSKRDFLSLPLQSGKSSGNGGRSRSPRKSRNVFFNDPRWPAMWYLNRGAGLDMNVIEAWNEGITGKGIVVTILDDGLEKDHPDIVRNYDPMASFDVNSLDMDPMPTYDLTDSNRHGTRCAGEVAAEANNTICAVGIAFEAGVGGVRMLDGDVTDAVEARSLSHNPQHIDIYSASWGPDDDGKTVDGPGELATRAFIEGVTKGRNGKGSIFVWASGNGGRDHDNCNCDGYTNSIWTLSISSATENGLVPWYSEACSSTLATTYSSGGTGEKQIVTIDLHHSCTSSHTGTSASAPLAAGICALALQANTNLTWRDMQHIVVRTARPNNLLAPDWAVNGVGRNVSHSFGYGLMDAGAMVKLARKWKTVPEQNKCEIKAPYTDKSIPAKSKVTLDLKVTDCPNVKFLEHVQAKVTLTSGRRGDLQIYLVSPSGTRSVLLAHRRHDLNRSGFTDWPFMSVHSWGENPLGKWTLEIHNEGRYTDHKNGRTVLKRWSLVIYGTDEDINSNDNSKLGSSPRSNSREQLTRPNPPKVPPTSPPRNPPPFFVRQPSTPNAKLPVNSLAPKTPSEIRDPELMQINEGQTSSGFVPSNVNFNTQVIPSPSPTSSNRKSSRQRINKGKNITKKQKVPTSVPPVVLKGLESHVIITSDDEEFERLLQQSFHLNQNHTSSSTSPNGTTSTSLLSSSSFSSSNSNNGGSGRGSSSSSGSSSDVTLNNKSRDATTPSSTSTSAGRNVTLSGFNNVMMTSRSRNSTGSSPPLLPLPFPSPPNRNFPVGSSAFSTKTPTSSSASPPEASSTQQTSSQRTPKEMLVQNSSSASAPLHLASINQTESHAETGKLQTWSLIAHGTTSNPNDLVDGNGSGLDGGSKKGIATATGSAGSTDNAPHPSVVEFDGSVNSLAHEHEHELQTSNSQPPHLFAANSDIAAADSSVSILSTSVASSPSSSAHCAKVSNNGQCLECIPGWALHDGMCMTSCPAKFYVTSTHSSISISSTDKVEQTRLTYLCLPCHYSCKTCSGPTDSHCLTCFEDAYLHKIFHDMGKVETHCITGRNIGDSDSSSNHYFWYKAIIVTLMSNLVLVVCIAVYIWKRKLAAAQFSNGRDPNQFWNRRSGGSRPYRRISPDEDNPTDVDDEEYEEEMDILSTEDDEELIHDSHTNLVDSSEDKSPNKLELTKFFKQNIASLHSKANLSPSDSKKESSSNASNA